MISNIIREYRSLTDESVKIYARSIVSSLSAYTSVLQRKFKQQNITNPISKLVDSTVDDIKDLDLYIKMLQNECETWQAKHSEFMLHELKLRNEIEKLKEELKQEKNEKSF